MNTKCPRCFSDLDDTSYAWTVSAQVPAQRYPDPVGSAFSGVQVECGPIHVINHQPSYLPSLHALAAVASRALKMPAVEICPVCHFILPNGWRAGQVTCIAMAGARTTGKSLYTAVLVKQLELLCERLGVPMDPVTPDTAASYTNNYERPLFVERGLIPPTPTARTQASYQRVPLIFSIGAWDGVRRFIVLRDVAGEDLEVGNLQAPYFQFFANADAVFFMFDPLRVQVIRDELQDLVPPQLWSAGDPRSILGNLLHAIGRGSPRLAVILTKFDVLRALRDVEGSVWGEVMSNAGAAFLRDPSSEHTYDEPDGQLLHEEVRSLLLNLGGGSVVAAVEHPASGVRLRHRFFVVSSLGHAPTGNRLSPRGIAPFRCTDPLRWVTSRFGVL